jgi:hypothetical protein
MDLFSLSGDRIEGIGAITFISLDIFCSNYPLPAPSLPVTTDLSPCSQLKDSQSFSHSLNFDLV